MSHGDTPYLVKYSD